MNIGVISNEQNISYHENRDNQEINVRNSTKLFPERLGQPRQQAVLGGGN
jgi:hypothetical protein